MSKLNVEDTIEQPSLEQKIQLLSGIDFWHTCAVPKLNIPSRRFSDGPNGVKGTKFFNGFKGAIFPNGTGLATTFDSNLLLEAGKLMAKEARHKGVHVILGPKMNIQRGPKGGRGFESFSEDPYVSGIVAS